MRTKTAVGLGLALASVPVFVGAWFVMQSATGLDLRDKRRNAATEEQCKSKLSELGRVGSLPGDVITLTIEDVGDTRATLATATAALAICPARTIASTCIGEECLFADADPLRTSEPDNADGSISEEVVDDTTIDRKVAMQLRLAPLGN